MIIVFSFLPVHVITWETGVYRSRSTIVIAETQSGSNWSPRWFQLYKFNNDALKYSVMHSMHDTVFPLYLWLKPKAKDYVGSSTTFILNSL